MRSFGSVHYNEMTFPIKCACCMLYACTNYLLKIGSIIFFVLFVIVWWLD